MTQQHFRPLVPEDLRRDCVVHLVRSAILVGRAALAGRDRQPLDAYAPPGWLRDREFEQVLRTASSPIASTTAPDISIVSVQFLRALVPYAAGAALLASGQQVSFNNAGSLTFPSLTAPSGMPTFVGEGAPIPSWNLTSSAGQTLSPSTFATMCSAASEML